jgi:hypothetical protein
MGNHDEILSSERCGCFYCMEIFLPGEVKKLPLQSNNFQSHRDSIPDANGDSLPFRRNKSCPKRPDRPETELPWPDPVALIYRPCLKLQHWKPDPTGLSWEKKEIGSKFQAKPNFQCEALISRA